MEELEASLKSITSTKDQWWEDAPGCIQKKTVSFQREHKNKKQSFELQALRLLHVPRGTQSRQRCTSSSHHWEQQQQRQQKPTPSWLGCMKKHSVTERAWKRSPNSRG